MRGALLLCLVCSALACAKSPAPPEKSAEVAAPAGQLYGAPIDPAAPRVALSQLLADPAAHAGKTVRTEGVVQRVCQRMGCWMELAEAEGKTALRVPMAGHAFFLPKDAQGKRAEVQGTLEVAKLSPEHKQHLESEGAQATGSDISLSATGVSLQ